MAFVLCFLFFVFCIHLELPFAVASQWIIAIKRAFCGFLKAATFGICEKCVELVAKILNNYMLYGTNCKVTYCQMVAPENLLSEKWSEWYLLIGRGAKENPIEETVLGNILSGWPSNIFLKSGDYKISLFPYYKNYYIFSYLKECKNWSLSNE